MSGRTRAAKIRASGLTLREFLWREQNTPPRHRRPIPTPTPTPAPTPTPDADADPDAGADAGSDTGADPDAARLTALRSDQAATGRRRPVSTS